MYSLNRNYDKVYLGDKQLLTGNIYLGDTLINTLNNERSVFKKWLYDVGDVIVYDKTRRTKHAIDPNRLSEISSEDYEAIGVVAIPSSHNVYGTREAGVIALKFNNHYTPDIGGEVTRMNWGYLYNDIGSKITLRGLGPTNNNPTNILSTYNYDVGYIPTEYGEGMASTNGLRYDSSLPNSDSSLTYIPSPYNDDGTKNSLYEESTNGFNGREKTKVLIEAYNKEGWKTAQGTPEILEESHIEIAQTPETLDIRWEQVEGVWEESNNTDSITGLAYIGHNPKAYNYSRIKFYIAGQSGDKVAIKAKVNTTSDYNYVRTLGIDGNPDVLGPKEWINFGTEENPSIVFELPDSNEHYIIISYTLSSNLDDFATVYITKSPTPHKVIDVPYQAATPAFKYDLHYNTSIPTPFLCSWRFHTNGTLLGDWYIPSIGELGYVISKLVTINFSLLAIQTWDNTSDALLFSYTIDDYSLACSDTGINYKNWGNGGSYDSYGIYTRTGKVLSNWRFELWVSRPFTRIKPNEFN